MTVYLRGHLSCSLSNFEGFYSLHRSRVFSNFQLIHLVTLMPLKVQDRVLPFWKPPINISLDLDCQGYSSSFSVKKAMLKNGFLHDKSLYA